MPSLLNTAAVDDDDFETKEDGLLYKEAVDNPPSSSNEAMIGGVIANSAMNAFCELFTAAAVGALFISKVLTTGMFIGSLAGGLIAYVVSLHWAGVLSHNLRAQGIVKPQFCAKSFWEPAAFGASGAFVLAAVGLTNGHWPTLSRNLLVCIGIYPLYGWAQQWLVQGLITRNLATLLLPPSRTAGQRVLQKKVLICTLSGAGFSLVHYPDAATIMAVACIGIAFAAFFLRDGEVFPLGLWHGWLGSLFYYWALGEDPLGDILAGK
mmetsp:Transcript_28131/g.62159  ORF Transcript_28131/g.62159 Transcript_28131/m.62159 type:complete len:265 (+) Transcript_28131:63-857(+)